MLLPFKLIPMMQGLAQIGLVQFASQLITFNPLSLFAAGEQGAIYDPSGLSTLFQDSAGTTPVTATGQPVGLILDKSKGLVRGPEIISNGDFENGLTGWSNPQLAYTVADGKLNKIGGIAGSLQQSIPLVAGRTYLVSCAIESISGGAVIFQLLGGTTVSAPTRSVAGEYSVYLQAVVGNSTIQLYGVAGTVAVIDNFTVREISGNHASQPTAARRPLYKVPVSKIDYDVIDDVLNITFPVSLGSNVTIARAIPGVGAQILTGQTVGTTYADNADHAGLIIVNRALTAAETAGVTSYLNEKAGV